MITYRSVQGDTIDLICWRYYGREDAAAAVLAANPGLALLPPHLPRGTVVRLPDLAPSPTAQQIQLWD